MNSGNEQRSVAFVDLAAQHAAIHDEAAATIERVLRNADFILGRDVESFEQEFAQYCECEYGVGVDSGTSALELALRVLETAPAPRTTVQSPLRWSADPAWKLDFSNLARLSPEEIARRRAEFDRQKEIAKTIRAKPRAAE